MRVHRSLMYEGDLLARTAGTSFFFLERAQQYIHDRSVLQRCHGILEHQQFALHLKKVASIPLLAADAMENFLGNWLGTIQATKVQNARDQHFVCENGIYQRILY